MKKFNLSRYLAVPVLCSLPLLMGALCGDDDKSYTYTLTVDGYRGNFSGYYYLDGKLKSSYYFTGSYASTNASGYNYYYYEVGFDSLSSIDVYVIKDDDYGQVTVSLWQDDVKLDSVYSGYHETQDDGTYVSSLDELYYEVTDTGTDDESD